jgi:hypothetical protein
VFPPPRSPARRSRASRTRRRAIRAALQLEANAAPGMSAPTARVDSRSMARRVQRTVSARARSVSTTSVATPAATVSARRAT